MEEKYYLQWMKKNQIESVLQTNQYTCRFGLSFGYLSGGIRKECQKTNAQIYREVPGR